MDSGRGQNDGTIEMLKLVQHDSLILDKPE